MNLYLLLYNRYTCLIAADTGIDAKKIYLQHNNNINTNSVKVKYIRQAESDTKEGILFNTTGEKDNESLYANARSE